MTQDLSPQATTFAPRTNTALTAAPVNLSTVDTTQPTQLVAPHMSTFAALAPVTPAPVTTPAAVDPVASFLVLPATIVSTATSLFSAVLSSFTGPAPGAPANPPLLWAVLEIVRRDFFNQTPQISDIVSKPDALGDITISLNATDADGDTLAYTATDGTKGTVALNADGHSLTYTPNPGETGTDTITVTATDAASPHIHGVPGLINALSFGLLGDPGNTATTTVTVHLNTPPTLTVTAGTPDQSTGKVTVALVTTDADGDTPTFSFSTPAGGSVDTPTLVDAATGKYTAVYTPSDNARFAATATDGPVTDTFNVTVDDKHGGVVTQPVTVTITPEDISANPKAAFEAVQSVVTDQIDAWETAQTNLETTIKSIDPTIDATDLPLTKAKVRVLVTAGLAQLGINPQDPNSGPTPQLGSDAKTALETTLGGPLTQTQVDDLTSEAMAVASSESKLKKPLDTSADAGALATWHAAGDGKPVFSRVEYTVAADGSVTGRVFFVDPNNDPAHPLVIGSPSEDAQFLDPTTPGSFTMPAPDPNNPSIPNIVTFNVTATDSNGNVVTHSITVDRTPRLPTSLTNTSTPLPFSDIVASFSDSIAGASDVYSAVAGYEAANDRADAKDLQAQAKYNEALLQQLDPIIDLAITHLAQDQSQFSTTLDQTASTTTSVEDVIKNRANSV